MKKIFLILLVIIAIGGCKKDKVVECYECKNLDRVVVQEYCDITQDEAELKAYVWQIKQINELNQKAMSDERYAMELRKITISGCNKK